MIASDHQCSEVCPVCKYVKVKEALCSCCLAIAQERAAISELIQRALAFYAAMIPEQRAEHDNAQRESFARGNLAIDRGPDARRTVSGPALVDTAAAELAQIVAWGRKHADTYCGSYCGLEDFLAAIERGEHKQPE